MKLYFSCLLRAKSSHESCQKQNSSLFINPTRNLLKILKINKLKLLLSTFQQIFTIQVML